MLLVRDAILTARDLRAAFDRQSTPDPVALRYLARYQQQLLTEISRWRADAVHATQTVTMPLADFAAGIALDDHLVLHGGTVRYTDVDRDPDGLELVEYPKRLQRYLVPAAYAQGKETLFLLGRSDDWTDVATIDIDLFPQGDDELGLDDFFVLPGSPMRACVDALGAFMAQRAAISYASDGSEASYLDEVTNRHRAKVGIITDSY